MKTKGLVSINTLALATIVIISFVIQTAQAATWVTNSPMTTARERHTATLLHNGKVLVAGGFKSPGGSLSSAELYDPATGT